MTDAERAFDLLHEIAEECREILQDNLLGVYVHGSLTFGCFTWKTSDIDFLLVAQREMTQDKKEQLMAYLLRTEEKAPSKGLEMSVMLSQHCRHFTHPAPYELHYSGAYRQACMNDLSGVSQSLHGVDPDLAAHCTVIKTCGKAIYGPDIAEVFGEVPREAYIDSILRDVENAREAIKGNVVYVTLNLCRVLAYLREGKVLSKKEGGEWGIRHLPQVFMPLLQAALAAYQGQGALEASPQADAFAAYMLACINDAK